MQWRRQPIASTYYEINGHVTCQRCRGQILAAWNKGSPGSRFAKALGLGVPFLAVALLLLFTAILPAEYGIDPLRTGKLLHLTGISQSDSNSGGRATAANAGIYTLQPATYKVDSEEIGLHPGEGFEIKYHMQKGATLIFAWKADGLLQFEFHGERHA